MLRGQSPNLRVPRIQIWLLLLEQPLCFRTKDSAQPQHRTFVRTYVQYCVFLRNSSPQNQYRMLFSSNRWSCILRHYDHLSQLYHHTRLIRLWQPIPVIFQVSISYYLRFSLLQMSKKEIVQPSIIFSTVRNHF